MKRLLCLVLMLGMCIFNAVADGASSVMVTGETAAGEYPALVIRYLYKTVCEAERFRDR
jgi:pyruvate kinase